MDAAGCLELEQLEALATGSASPDSVRNSREHLSSCERCRAHLADVEGNLELEQRARASLRPESVPISVGPYRIVRELGRGSMGVVYLAEQEQPRRLVALKLIPEGDDRESLVERIAREAEVLAQLRHPGIAQVFAAGQSPRPFFAMEYVEGDRLDHHANHTEMDVAARLRLLARVCDAVEHAHRHGVIHRDLKPSNILVDAEGRPKVLDFGVARVVGGSGNIRSMHTAVGQLVGTIPFMSPEQVEGDSALVDARSDVYALGVVGYALLSSKLPYDLDGCSLPEAARIIRDDHPLPLRALRSDLPADVETILLKAIEKERERRYATAAALAEDLRRYLQREPILARRASAAYQVRRFAQRNPGLASAMVALFVVLASAAIVSTMLALHARHAEVEARNQVARYESVNRFLQEMLSAASPEENPGQPDATVRDVLGRAVAELDGGSLHHQPGIELGVRTTLGDTYRALGDFAAAKPQLETAVAIGRQIHPDGHADLALAINKLARVLGELGDVESAEALNRECLEMRRRLFGAVHADVATSLNNLADVRRIRGDAGGALQLHEEALAMRRQLLGPAHVDIANSLNNLAALYYGEGDRDHAAALFRESLEMDRELRGELHPNVVVTMTNLGTVLFELGESDEAESLFARAVELQRGLQGNEHPSVAAAWNKLARAQIARGNREGAADSYEQSIAILATAFGDEDPRTRGAIERLAALYAEWNRPDDAERWRTRLRAGSP